MKMKRFLMIALFFGTTALGMSEPVNCDYSDEESASCCCECCCCIDPVFNDIRQYIEQIPNETLELVDWYRDLLDGDKIALSLGVQRIPPFPSCCTCHNCRDFYKNPVHPLTVEKNLKLIVAHARQILDTYPRDRIFCLGQSPAYIIEAAKIMKLLEGESIDNISTIAFSGTLLKLCKRKNVSICYVLLKNPSRRQIREKIAAYRNYLTSLGLDPETIVNEYQHGARTVIVDFAHSGSGLASFILLLKNWAKETGLYQEVMEALYTNIFVTSDDQPPFKLFPHYTKHQINESVMSELCGSDVWDDRLVWHYSFKDWGTEFNPSVVYLSPNAKLLCFHLVDYLAKNYCPWRRKLIRR